MPCNGQILEDAGLKWECPLLACLLMSTPEGGQDVAMEGWRTEMADICSIREMRLLPPRCSPALAAMMFPVSLPLGFAPDCN